MTLALKSPVERETATLVKHRALIVELTAYAAVLREKGRRDRVTVPWDAVLDLGYKLRAREKAAEKRKQHG